MSRRWRVKKLDFGMLNEVNYNLSVIARSVAKRQSIHLLDTLRFSCNDVTSLLASQTFVVLFFTVAIILNRNIQLVLFAFVRNLVSALHRG